MSLFRVLSIVLSCGGPLIAWPAHADPFAPGQGLDRALIAEVATAALAFIGPRTLEPVPASRLTLWGVRGLSTLDPRITIEARDKDVNVFVAGRSVLALDVPPEADEQGWGTLVGRVAQAAWNSSEAVRRAGTQGIITGFFNEMFSYLDPYSRYVPPREATKERDDRRGQVKLGLTVALRDGVPIVIRLAPGGPGTIAGLRVGDRLLSIDGQTIEAGIAIGDIADLLDGEEGSTVPVEALGQDGRVRRLTVTRELVVPVTVTASRAGTLLLLRVTGFNRDTGAALARELSRAVAGPRPPSGAVLDLRGNRGGLLREAVAAAETLLSGGTVARTTGRGADANRDYTAEGHDLLAGRPIVVLVNGLTASAAEVLAAGLADQGRAVLVGSVTFGKGLVQTITSLPDGGDLFVSWRRVIAPLDWPIQGLGVMPRVCTSLGDGFIRAQLTALGRGRLLLALAVARARAARAPVPPAEALDIRGACPPAEGGAPDMVAARFVLDHAKAYGAAAMMP